MAVRINRRKEKVQLSRLVNMKSSNAVFEEVRNNFIRFYPASAFEEIKKMYKDFVDLFSGKYPGYQSCNTMYHDKIHTTDTLLALSRLIDGYNIERKRKLPLKRVNLALIAMLFHDSGFIQKKRDVKGTGAKYTKEHIVRSIEFIKSYFAKVGLSAEGFISVKNMISCTGLTTNISGIRFNDKAEETLGVMLGTADVLGQMADRNYLEKLLLLYHEFREGNVPGYESELDLLKKTLIFYGFIQMKLANDYKGVYRFVKTHFSRRYHINKDLYQDAIGKQMKYLKKILKNSPEKYRNNLRRRINPTKIIIN